MRKLLVVALVVLAGCGGSPKVVDDINLPFVSDPLVIGEWRSVDFVKTPDQFSASERKWGGELVLQRLVFSEDGKTNETWWTWTKGFLIHHGDKTAAKYFVKEEGGAKFMFLEWKTGDYTSGKSKPLYYVLKKV